MTTADFVKKYQITLESFNRKAMLSELRWTTWGVKDEVMARKDEILSYLTEHHEKDEALKAVLLEKSTVIPGLSEIRSIENELKKVRIEEFDLRKNDEFEKLDAIESKRQALSQQNGDLRCTYPRAVAFLHAEYYADTNNHYQCGPALIAMQRLIDGDDPDTVTEELNKEIFKR